jgi:hypothetical protein
VVALTVKAEALAQKAQAQHLEALFRPRQPLGQRNAEAPELVRRVAHADADLDPPAAQVVEHCEILGQAQRMVERHDDPSAARGLLGQFGDEKEHQRQQGIDGD